MGSIVNGNVPVDEEDITLSDDLLQLRAADKIQSAVTLLPKA